MKTLYWAGTNRKQSLPAQILLRIAGWLDGIPLEVEEREEDFTLEHYQEMARDTAIYPAMYTVEGLTYVTLGLTGEAGEIANKVKKILRDNNGVLTDDVRLALRKEAGDVFWYFAQLATELRTTLKELAADNLKKLAERKKKGTLAGSGDNR